MAVELLRRNLPKMRFNIVAAVGKQFLRAEAQFKVVELDLQFLAVLFQVSVGIVLAFPCEVSMRDDARSLLCVGLSC